MAKKGRLPKGYPPCSAPNYESEVSGCSGRVDAKIAASKNSSAPRRKWITLNSASSYGFGIPIKYFTPSKMSLSEREDLARTLRAELEQISLLQSKIDLRRKADVTVSSYSDILSCSNVKNGLPIGNMKRSPALIDKPGKKFNPASIKGRGWNRGTSGRFESLEQHSTPNTSKSNIMKQCENLLNKLMSHQFGWVFNTPVDVVQLNIPDYFTIIKHPMDFGTIKKKIASCEYSTPLDFLADIRLTFSNAMTYNPPGNDFHVMAKALSNFFEIRWKPIGKKFFVNDYQALPEASGLHVMEKTKPMPTLKKRKISPTQHEVQLEPFEQIMTDQEKQKLSKEFESLLGELPDNIIEFLREISSSGKEAGEDEIEIEIDIDVLSDDTLFKLRKLLDDYLHEKHNRSKDEPCEIELLNESGLSNSSLKLDKGGNEPPVSSYPPVEIQRDSGRRNNKRTSPGSPSDSDSDSESSSSSDSESNVAKPSGPVELSKENSNFGEGLDDKTRFSDFTDGNQSVSGLDQLEQTSQQKPNSVEPDCCPDGESAPPERAVSPNKLYRAALLKKRFADTILKAREKTLTQGEKVDPETLRREREELELQKSKEKAQLQAEVKAAEDARRRAEAEVVAAAKRQIELEREAARQALLKMEKTVEINETSRFLEDLEMLKTVPPEQLPSSVDETSPERSLDGVGSFKFGGSNPLEQLGLFMKVDEEEEDAEPPSTTVPNDVEEGEID